MGLLKKALSKEAPRGLDEAGKGEFDLDVPEERIPAQEAETPAETAAAAANAPVLEAEENEEAVRTKIAAYCQTNANFQGILLETPGGTQKNNALSFAERVWIMAGALGFIIVLPSNRLLILLPPSLDRELIAHRLSLSLGSKVLVCCQADNPEKALELLRPYL
jgi:hypothetical protein